MASLTTRARSRTLPASMAVMLVLAILPFLIADQGYVFAITLGMIYAIAVVGLDVFSGYSGVLSLCNFGFLAIGSYSSTVLAVQYKWDLWLALPASIALTAFAALIVGVAIVRLKSLGAALATFFLAFVIVILIEGPLLRQWTASADGIAVPILKVGDLRLADGPGLYGVTWVLLLIVLLVSNRYVNSRAGKALRLVKRSDIVANALGVNAYAAKLSSFVYSAMAAGCAGFVFAQANAFLSPASFGGLESVLLLAMAVVGGLGSLAGAVIGAVTFSLLDEASHSAGGAREVIFAGLLLVFLVLLPQGIYGGLERIVPPLWRRLPLPGRPAPAASGEGDAAPAATRPVWATPRRETGPVEAGALALRVTDVGVRFSGLAALVDVTLDVPRHSIYGIMGPNGAGKTTLLNCISGIQPHAGRIFLEGDQLSGMSTRRIRRLGVTRTFQHPSLVEDLSVRENVDLGHYGGHPASPLRDAIPSLGAVRRQRRDREIGEWALDLVNFPRARRALLASDLTLAEQKLADVARAVAGRPRLLLMDEPTAGLEEDEMRALADVIRRVRSESDATVVVIAHHVGFLRSIADYATVMDFGRVLAQGTPAEVIARDDVATVFLGEKHG